MMAKPEEVLGRMSPESPPPEIVLSALRVFRYRALAAVALAVAIVVSAFLVKDELDESSRLRERIAEVQYSNGGDSPALLERVVGVNVMFWEIVVGDDSVFVHVIAWDPRGRDFTLDVVDPTIGGEPAARKEVVGFGGGRGITNADVWQEIAPVEGAEGDVAFEVEVRGAELSGEAAFTYRISEEAT